MGEEDFQWTMTPMRWKSRQKLDKKRLNNVAHNIVKQIVSTDTCTSELAPLRALTKALRGVPA
eukprot:6494468-Pyramimonas_sp.AAC.1